MCYMYKLTYFVDSWFNLHNDQCVLWYSVMKFFLVCHTDLVSMESINLCKFMSRCPDVLPDIGRILNLLRKYWVIRCSLSAGIYGTLKKNCWLDKSIVVWLDFKPCLYFNHHAPDLHCSCMNFFFIIKQTVLHCQWWFRNGETCLRPSLFWWLNEKHWYFELLKFKANNLNLFGLNTLLVLFNWSTSALSTNCCFPCFMVKVKTSQA